MDVMVMKGKIENIHYSVQDEIRYVMWRKRRIFRDIHEAMDSWYGWQELLHLYNWNNELDWTFSIWHVDKW